MIAKLLRDAGLPLESAILERSVLDAAELNQKRMTTSHTEIVSIDQAHPPRPAAETAFGCSRDFLDNRYVYTVVSPRAGGLSIGVDMNPDQQCNFDCTYCEVVRRSGLAHERLDVDVLGRELEKTLNLVNSGAIRERPSFKSIPESLLRIRQVALSGDGEPTICTDFSAAVQAVLHVRAYLRLPFFKVVLITNASGLHLPDVQYGLGFFTSQDEVWAKLEAGSDARMAKINRTNVPLESIMTNILDLARKRPVIIQSLFPSVDGLGPTESEIEEYAVRLRELKQQGANIPLVQIYSATRPAANSGIGHLPLQTLSRIARTVRDVAGLRAEVF